MSTSDILLIARSTPDFGLNTAPAALWSLSRITSSCSRNTNHEISTHIHHCPEILVFVINRFNTAIVGDKNRTSILVDEQLNISNVSFRLIGAIYHHGRTINSGHYTSNVFYERSAYTCNDSQITPFVHSNSSDSIYLAFYSRS